MGFSDKSVMMCCQFLLFLIILFIVYDLQLQCTAAATGTAAGRRCFSGRGGGWSADAGVGAAYATAGEN